MQVPPMPFKILALAPFTHQQETCWSEDPIRLDTATLDQVMDELGLSFYVPIPQDLCPAGGLDIACKKLKDFHPDGLCQSNAFLKNLLDAKTFLQEAKVRGLSSKEVGIKLKEWPGLPPMRMETEVQEIKRDSTSGVDDILKLVALPEQGPASVSKTQTLNAQIDVYLQQVLSRIFSCKAFMDLEAVWRGIKVLVDQGEVGGDVKVDIVPASFETLEETLSRLMTTLVYDLPSLVIVDLPFDNSPRSLEYLENIAHFAETLLCPAVCWVTQKFLLIDSWNDMNRLAYLPHYLEEPTFAKWRTLAESPSAKWLAVTCNRFLARFPYGPDNRPRSVSFHESESLWASPVWAIGCLVSQSLEKTGWPTHFTDWQNIKLEGLALDTSQPNKPIATEASIPEDRIDQFVRAGIMPLIGFRNKDIAFVPAETTVGKGSFGYQASVARITHFVLWCKDSFAKNLGPRELEAGLTKAFSLFWEKTGDATPKSLDVSVSDPDEENRMPVRIVVEPSPQILPSGKMVELEFVW